VLPLRVMIGGTALRARRAAAPRPGPPTGSLCALPGPGSEGSDGPFSTWPRRGLLPCPAARSVYIAAPFTRAPATMPVPRRLSATLLRVAKVTLVTVVRPDNTGRCCDSTRSVSQADFAEFGWAESVCLCHFHTLVRGHVLIRSTTAAPHVHLTPFRSQCRLCSASTACVAS
jgi:hypothetical protein